MKKLLLILCAIAFGVSGANANVTLAKQINMNQACAKTPAEYTVDNKDKLIILGEQNTIGIYDDELNFIKEIEVAGTEVTAKTTYWSEQTELVIEISYDSEEQVDWSDWTLDEVKSYIGDKTTEEKDGKVYYDVRYWAEEQFGDKYLQEYHYYMPNGKYNEENEALYSIYYRYIEYYYEYKYNGEWEISGVDEYTYSPEASWIGIGNLYLYVTQTLFNTDSNYEYISPIRSIVESNEEDEHWKSERQEVITTGFNIISEDGTILNSITYPDGYTALNNDVNYECISLNSKNYLKAYVWDENYNRYILLYAIDSSNSSIKSVGAPIKVKVHPTVPQRGESVNVDLSEELTQGAIINVTSASGNVVMTQKVAAGTNRATIDTSSLQRGMYIVTVNNGKATRENTKIIIR
jgi:hypothetical protein